MNNPLEFVLLPAVLIYGCNCLTQLTLPIHLIDEEHMNTIDEAIAVLQAMKEDKQVQVDQGGKWIDVGRPYDHWMPLFMQTAYRVEKLSVFFPGDLVTWGSKILNYLVLEDQGNQLVVAALSKWQGGKVTIMKEGNDLTLLSIHANLPTYLSTLDIENREQVSWYDDDNLLTLENV